MVIAPIQFDIRPRHSFACGDRRFVSSLNNHDDQGRRDVFFFFSTAMLVEFERVVDDLRGASTVLPFDSGLLIRSLSLRILYWS